MLAADIQRAESEKVKVRRLSMPMMRARVTNCRLRGQRIDLRCATRGTYEVERDSEKRGELEEERVSE